MNIVITGMMGVGKTTVGRELAQRLSLRFLDLDSYIEEMTGLEIPDIFARYGESRFRKLEQEACRRIAKEKDLIIATGGGTLLDRENLNLLSSSGIVITLLSSPEEALRRLRSEYLNRPLLTPDPEDNFIKLYREREPYYLRLPNRIDTTNLSPVKVVEEILKILKGEEKVLEITLEGKRSPVLIRRGAIEDIGLYIEDILKEKRVFILSDETVFPIYKKKLLNGLKRANIDHSVFLIPPGEREKNLETAEKLYSWLIKEKANRSSLLIAFGGGVITDLGGYVASTFHRGINLVNVPTTLLAQIDAGIGGKNGVNLGEAKNQIGTFYFPGLVLIDPLLLISLDPSNMREGMIEALKAGVIGDEGLFELIRREYERVLLKDFGLLEELIIRAVRVKVDIVSRDPFEKNERRVLNLGHTFGHALEGYSDYEISHGQAVGLGMISAAKLGMILGVTQEGVLVELKKVLKGMGVPTYLRDGDPAEIVSIMEYDKKRRGKKLSFIIPKRIGKVVIMEDVGREDIIESLKEISNG